MPGSENTAPLRDPHPEPDVVFRAFVYRANTRSIEENAIRQEREAEARRSTQRPPRMEAATPVALAAHVEEAPPKSEPPAPISGFTAPFSSLAPMPAWTIPPAPAMPSLGLPRIDVRLEFDDEQEGEVLLLTRRKQDAVQSVLDEAGASVPSHPLADPAGAGREGNVVPLRNNDSMELEALSSVPDLRSFEPPPPPILEGIEDGQIPAGELDRVMRDMLALYRYGHRDQVRVRLERLVRDFPQDLLLLRRVAEFHVENRDHLGAKDALFLLATRLFRRRNVVGMRRALEQILVLDPSNPRVYRLLGLLDERPSTGTGG